MPSIHTLYDRVSNCYPYTEGIWPVGPTYLIVGRSPKIYPQLFVTSGNEILTWKDGINED